MKRVYIFGISLLLVLAALTSCADKLIQLKNENGLLVNKSQGLAYKSLPTYFEPAETLEEYAEFKSGKLTLTLYSLAGMDPTEWLSEKYAGIGVVFCAEDIEVPTLSSFEANKIILCKSAEITIGIETFEDPEFIDTVIDMYENGEEAEWPLINSIGIYQIKFVSEKYPGIYYNLEYGVFEEGTFIYDRSTKKCVPGGNIFDETINGK